MMTPTVVPIVVPLPSLGHRQFCVAGLARGHPDSGGAAIMGVPSPHIVLPLSGCLSRRTPTRATRGEARGHRSVFAQNPLLMYPLLFVSWGWMSAWCALARWWTGPHCVCAAVVTFLSGVVRWCPFACMWVDEKTTARLLWLCVCVLFVPSIAVWASAAVGHVHTVAMSGFGPQPDITGVAPLMGTLALRGRD